MKDISTKYTEKIMIEIEHFTESAGIVENQMLKAEIYKILEDLILSLNDK